MEVQVVGEPIERVPADGIVVPVDGPAAKGRGMPFGGPAGRAVRAALNRLPADERADQEERIADDFQALQLGDGDAGLIEGVGPWRWIIAAGAFLHSAGARTYEAGDHAAVVRKAIARSVAVAASGGVRTVATALIGTHYRMPADRAIRALADGLAAAAGCDVVVRWCLLEDASRQRAREACARLGLRCVD